MLCVKSVYVDLERTRGGSACANLNFQLGSVGVGTSVVSRQWSIRVTQVLDLFQIISPPKKRSF